MKAPCKDCPDRTENGACHASCGAYLAFRAERDKENAARLADDPYAGYKREKTTKKLRRATQYTRRRRR